MRRFLGEFVVGVRGVRGLGISIPVFWAKKQRVGKGDVLEAYATKDGGILFIKQREEGDEQNKDIEGED